MSLVTNAVVSNDSHRSSLVASHLEFLEERLAEPERANLLWLIEDSKGQYPRVNHLGPVVLVGQAQQAPEGAAPGPVAAQTEWPLTLRAAQHCLSCGYRDIAQQEVIDEHLVQEFVGGSTGVQNLKRQLLKFGPANCPVLVDTVAGGAGESVARALHRLSSRSAGAFVPVNCNLIPGELIDSELFGHEQGAFVGALSRKIGRLELANSGTLFIENIDKLPVAQQSKLMRFLASGCFERLGALQESDANVRIMASTTQALEPLVTAQEFRSDLMLHLQMAQVQVPPLAQRAEDLPDLLHQAVLEIRNSQGLDVRLTVDAIEQLSQYHWPGDTTELRNLVMRLAIEYPHRVVSTNELPSKYVDKAPGPKISANQSLAPASDLLPLNGIDLKTHIATLEQRLIEQALEDSNAVVARAADRLHIRRTTLVEKMRKYGISRAS